MGTRVAPTYANIFMGKLEKITLSKCPRSLKEFLHTWRRFIDDILVIWTGTDEQFREFFNFLNSFHRTIKYNSDENSCDFLDLKILIRSTGVEDESNDLFKREDFESRLKIIKKKCKEKYSFVLNSGEGLKNCIFDLFAKVWKHEEGHSDSPDIQG